jgi:YXWGXW repeat-containing protein
MLQSMTTTDLAMELGPVVQKLPFSPRNPQQQSLTGQAKDERTRGNTMHSNPAVRSLLFALFVLSLVVLAMPAASLAQVGIAITIGPPALPVYDQPPCPAEGYLWTPGYWAYDYDDSDYYWVPGTWVLAPEPGFLWTPGWWGWSGGAFVFNEGYWGPHVGFYGGIAYGFGYTGEGYQGGRWDNGHFFYNQSVNNVNVTNIHNTYNTTVINNTTVNHVSYNGGNGGITARPTPEEERAATERHIAPVAVQTQHVQAARADQQLRASVNQGKPPVAATARPGDFKSAAVPAKEAGAPYHPPANRGETQQRGNEQNARPENNVPRPGAENNAARPAEGNNAPRPNAVHPNELPAGERPAPPNTGNAKLDQKYQQQQQKLATQQENERQKLQQQQEQEHQKMAQQMANEKQKQQIEQKHQQQTQQLQQKHAQQQQQLQERQQRTQPQQRPAAPEPAEPKK